MGCQNSKTDTVIQPKQFNPRKSVTLSGKQLEINQEIQKEEKIDNLIEDMFGLDGEKEDSSIDEGEE